MENKYRWLTPESQTFLERDYLLTGQTLDQRVDIICAEAERRLGIKDFAKKFKENIQKGWYSLSTPVWTNYATNRGLPISCFGSYVDDNMESILHNIAEVGMMNVRNFITNYFDEGDHLVMIDDDIADITFFEKYYSSLSDFFTNAFELCIENKCRLWGIYPVNNAYFMTPRIVVGLTYICGGLYGVINNKNLLVSISDKEDFQRSIQYYMEDGKVIRYECIGIDTKGYTGIGGMNIPNQRTNEIILASAVKLTEAYPLLAKLNLTKASGKPEIKLKRIILKTIEL
jgi:hypothetical protein